MSDQKVKKILKRELSSRTKYRTTYKDIKHYFFGRKILICREMTKFYEEYIRVDINDLEPFKPDPKGELTLVISENLKKILFIITPSNSLIVE